MRASAILLALTIPFWVAAAHAAGLRCNGQIVDQGDLEVQVLNDCGQPDFVDPWHGAASFAFPIHMVQWTYNFGPGQLLYTLTFNGGRLQRVESAGYGFRAPGPGSCRPSDIVFDMTKYRLLQDCGPPAQRSGFFILSSDRRIAGREFFGTRGLVPVFRERWIYNFGNSRLLREVTLENGRVVDVETEGRGFD